MCGILGSVKFTKVDEIVFLKQLDSQIHRGPDASGVWFNDSKTVALGSRRLAIQDLSPTGNMPMHSSDDKVHIVLNGEIYNFIDLRNELSKLGYRFNSGSDTEVVLSAYLEWNTLMVDKLIGMFSISIYDEKRNEIILLRDRVGEKPLYYWHHDNGISFSSTLKSLFLDKELGRKIDLEGFNQYLEYGYTVGGTSIIKGVKKVPPAHYLVYKFDNNKVELNNYWKTPLPNENQSKDKVFLVNELERLLSLSIKRQLTSDVPVGILLSGGVDSSIVTALAAKNSSDRVKTFHIAMSGNSKYNESKYARVISDFFDTEHYELSSDEIIPSMIDELLGYLDEPIADSSLLPTYLVSKLTSKHVTVALGGDGGDELFGGYKHYKRWLKYEDIELPGLLKSFGNDFINILPLGLKGRNALKERFSTIEENILKGRFFDHFSRQKLIKSEFILPDIQVLFQDSFHDLSIIDKATRYDFSNYLVDDILVKIDRMSMAFSLEMRAPWLDKNVIEFSFSQVPQHFKSSLYDLKILPKELAKKILPENLDLNRKQGFSIPLSQWINNSWSEYFRETIVGADSDIFNIPHLLKILNREKETYYSNSSRLFAIIIFIRWMNKYDVKFE